jgi:long-chain acyl-CoA synthetase
VAPPGRTDDVASAVSTGGEAVGGTDAVYGDGIGAVAGKMFYFFFHALGIPLLEAYGVSECAVPLSLNRPNDYKIGTVGRPLMSNNLNVDGGEIEVDGPAVFKGYENQATQTNLTSGKYLSTGDVGKLDEEGYLQLLGRKGDLIKTSTGRKIAPAAIEQKLMKYLRAEQAMVMGEGRPYLVAIVCYDGGMTEEQKATFEKNLAKMNEGLADHERVRRCVVLDRLFSLERGELTRTSKLRRENIESAHEGVFRYFGYKLPL